MSFAKSLRGAPLSPLFIPVSVAQDLYSPATNQSCRSLGSEGTRVLFYPTAGQKEDQWTEKKQR